MKRSRKMRFNLAGKIIAWSFVPAIIILGASAAATFAAYQNVTETLVMERNQEVARGKSIQLANKLSEYGEIIATEARAADLTSQNYTLQQNAIERANSRWGIFDQGMVLLDSRGVVLATVPERTEVVGQDWSNRDYFRQAVQAQSAGSLRGVYSDVVYDGPDGTQAIAIAAPIVGARGEFIGSLVGILSAQPDAHNALQAAIVRLRLVDDGSAYLTDGKGQVIYHTDPSFVGGDFSSAAPVEHALSNKVGAVRIRGDNAKLVASFAPIPSTNWALVIQENWSTLQNRGRAYQPFLLGMLLLGVAVPSLVVAYSVQRITGPVRALTEAAHQVADGQFQQSIQTETGDEIEELAESFNGMAQQLQALHDHQEERIAQRTRELACLNAIAATVSRSTDLDEVLDSALTETLGVVGVESGGIYLLDESGPLLNMVAHRGFSQDFIAKVDPLRTDEGIAKTLVQSGLPLAVPDLATDRTVAKQAVREAGFRSLAAAPLTARGQVTGAIFTLTHEYRNFDQEDLDLMDSIGNQIGVAAEIARSREQAQQLAVMEERQRLARELHDAVTQTLFSASLLSEALPAVWQESPTQGQEILEELRRLNKGALAEMRTLLLELRPAVLAEAKLEDLLHQLGQAVTGRTGAVVDVQIGTCPPLPTDVHVAFYRVAQESLNNVIKHSHASEVVLGLECKMSDHGDHCAREAVLWISDNGRGFERGRVAGERLGLGIMQERAADIGADLVVDSQPDSGTKVRLTWQG